MGMPQAAASALSSSAASSGIGTAGISTANAQHLAVQQAVWAHGVAPARGDARAELAVAVDGEHAVSIKGCLSSGKGLLGQGG
jgi:hypothetical protein